MDEHPTKKRLFPYSFTNSILEKAFNNNLDSHHLNNIYSKVTITPKGLKIEKNCVNNKVKEIANIYARIMNRNIFIYQTVCLARFDEQDENGQILEENELYFNLKFLKY